MWGAITANLTRALSNNPSHKDYQDVGKFVRENIRTSYFYPALKKDESIQCNDYSDVEIDSYIVFLPRYTKEGLKFGELFKEEFERRFISSIVSTALDASTKSAEEGSLHEIEFICNKVRLESRIHNVYWIGYLFINSSLIEEKKVKIKGKPIDLQKALEVIHVGGERNYGFGRLSLCRLEECKSNEIFKMYEVYLDKDDPVLECKEYVPSHVRVEENLLICGEIEPLVGLDWGSRGAGGESRSMGVFFTPGSCLDAKKYEIKEYGTLRAIRSNTS
jgi:hypothetical protein